MSQRLISRLSSFSQSHLPDIRKIHHVKSYLLKIKEKIKHIITSFTVHDRWTGPKMFRMKMKIKLQYQCNVLLSMPQTNQKANYKSQYV